MNPLLAEGQVHGGIAQGLAQALYERVTYDADGTPLTADLTGYRIPSAADLPAFTTTRMETPTPLNPLGAKGIGESGAVGSTPAVLERRRRRAVASRRPPPRAAADAGAAVARDRSGAIGRAPGRRHGRPGTRAIDQAQIA